MAERPPHQFRLTYKPGNEFKMSNAVPASGNSQLLSPDTKVKHKKLPMELMTLVLKFYLAEEQNVNRGTGSALFVALSASPKLYDEALKIFYEKYYLSINRDNVVGFENNFSRERLGLIKHLKLELR